MDQYVIKPWDNPEATGPKPVDWDLHVPPEIDELAVKVMTHYDMSVSDRRLITSKPDKGGAIWRIQTNKGPRSLKLLHRAPARSMFSVGAQAYIHQQGGRVPALIPAKDGKLFVESGGKLWIVTDWVEPLTPATKIDLAGAQQLCYGLGEFHRYSKGYVPPQGAKNASRLHKWPNYYKKVAKKIGWLREVAKVYNDIPASKSILSVVDLFERQAWDALQKLNESPYRHMVAMGEPYWGLVHQDYGWSNGQMGPGGLWVIDLDGVAYDLPFRDLRKLITSTMDDMGVWDTTWMRGMIEAYHEANPLSAESFDVLLIDMALPNEFYKHLKEVFFDPVTFLSTGGVEAIQQRIVAADQSKWQALAELAKDKSKYKAEHYEQLAALRQPRRPVRESVPDADKWVLQQPAQADAQPESAKKGKRRTAEQREPVAQEKRREDAQRESAVQEKRRTAEEPAAVTKEKERVGASLSETEVKDPADVSKAPVVRDKARVKLKAAGAKGVYRKRVRKVKREESRLQKRRPSVKTATSVSRRKPETSRSTTKRKPVQTSRSTTKRKPVQTSRSTTKRKPVQTSRSTTKRKPTQPAPPAAKRRPKQKSKTGVIKLKQLIKRAASTVQRKRKVQKPSALTRRADKDKKQAVKNRKRLFGQTAAT
ncbi:CotS family spore coat protein [Brevibacillus thermoruber]|uniref:CotS family spore coat protein n=1 Tax=Brevibacillus thermoruber TaxID=33942 RepID=UPI00404100C7